MILLRSWNLTGGPVCLYNGQWSQTISCKAKTLVIIYNQCYILYLLCWFKTMIIEMYSQTITIPKTRDGGKDWNWQRCPWTNGNEKVEPEGSFFPTPATKHHASFSQISCRLKKKTRSVIFLLVYKRQVRKLTLHQKFHPASSICMNIEL